MAYGQLSSEQIERVTPEQASEWKQNVRLLRSDNGEIEIFCEGRPIIKAHGDVICPRSGFFRGAFTNAFTESITGKIHLEKYVTSHFLDWILVYIYLSIPEAGINLEVFGPRSDAEFFDFMFELYRQADYLQVRDLTVAIIKELKERLEQSARNVFRLQLRPSDPVFKEAYEITMKAVLFAYDESNEYHPVYEAIRDELFCWIETCYPVLSRFGDDFYDYLVKAPQLSVAILKLNRNIETSKFIDPGPEASCMFCGNRVGREHASMADHAQPTFGVVADRSGGVKYFCARSSCFRKISVNGCFNGTHECVGPFGCVCGRWVGR